MKRKAPFSNTLQQGTKVQSVFDCSGRIARPPPAFKPAPKFTSSLASEYFDPDFRLLVIEDYASFNLDGWALCRYELIQLEGVLVGLTKQARNIWKLTVHAPSNVNESTEAYCFPAQMQGLPPIGMPVTLIGKYRAIQPGAPVLHVFRIK